MSNYKFIENGSVTSPLGFVAGGVIAGIKPSNTTKRDLGMIFCEKPCAAAAIFTKNRVKSDTIFVTQTMLSSLPRALSVRRSRLSLSKRLSARLRTV